MRFLILCCFMLRLAAIPNVIENLVSGRSESSRGWCDCIVAHISKYGLDAIVQPRGFGSVLNPIFSHVGYSSFEEVTPSTPDEIASLNADLVVDGFVSAASGQLALAQTDLHIRGAQELLLQRTYVPPHILGRYDDKDTRDQLALGRALSQLYARRWGKVIMYEN